MRKKILAASAAALVLALATCAFGCGSNGASDGEASSSAGSDTTARHAYPLFIGSEDIDNSYDSYLTLEANLATVAATTESYGDSNPHANIHGAALTCDNCHEDDAEMTVKDDMVCYDCHAWPRDLQSAIS